MSGDDGRRVAVTGIGVVAPGGTGTGAFWDRVVAGRPATRGLTAFDATGFRSRIAAEVDFVPDPALLPPDRVATLDRATQFALTCTAEALAAAGLSTVDATVDGSRVGVAIGSAVGCTTRLEEEYLAISDRGARWEVDHKAATPQLYEHFVPSSIAVEVARLAGAAGPVALVSAGCTSGLDAIGHAAGLIAEGSADVMVAGGADAPISPITVACFDAIRATSDRNDDPGTALRPFDRSRNGFVLGEGAAVLVLEELGHARRRGAEVLAVVGGFAARSNAFHMTGLRPDGAEMAAALSAALAAARTDPADVDYVNAHGTATKQNDRHETAAIRSVLGPHTAGTPVSSIKAVVGHSLGAIGSIEVAACVLALRDGVVPPTANLHDPDPELALHHVPLTARSAPLCTVASLGSGFGGFQSAIVLHHRAAA
jgi:minimal PKS ketosynthase (KS/KS alpha)